MRIDNKFMGGKRSLFYKSFVVLVVAALVFAVSCSDTASYYDVYFYTNGGTSVPSQQVKKGGYAQVPLTPQKEGYNFAGWYANSLLTIPYLFNEPVTKETLIYAKWEEGLSASDYTMPEGGSWFTIIKNACGVEKSQVKKISFLKELPLDIDVKASVPLNKGLMAYVVESGGVTSVLKDSNASMCDMYIVGEHFYCNADSSRMFEGFDKLVRIDLTNFNTSNATNMSYVFYNCSSLTSLNVNSFDTSNVTNMGYMFYGCESLTSLNVNGFDTSKVTNMGYMFYNCKGLTSLDVSSFETSNVTDMRGMFGNCFSLVSLDVGSFDTSNVTNMREMFFGYDGESKSELTSITFGSNFDTSNVADMGVMFYGCESLTSLDVSGFNTSNVTDMSNMFYKCSSLTSLNVNSFDTSNVTNMGYMFYGCESLTSLNVNGFDTSKVTNMQNMFMKCSELEVLNLNFDTSKVTNMSVMFYGCSSLTSIAFGSNFDTSSVKYMPSMFSSCSDLTELDLSGFDTSSVEDMSNMFSGCKKLKNLNVSGFDTSRVECMARMFYDCEALTTLDLSSFDVKKVGTVPAIDEWDFDKMFCNCSYLETIYAASGADWSTSAASSTNMFYGCSKLKGGNNTEYDSTKVDKTYARIDGGPESLTPGYFTVKAN